MTTLITDSIFAAYLDCETKAHLVAVHTAEPPTDINEWRRRLTTDCKTHWLAQFAAANQSGASYNGTPSSSALRSKTYRFITNCTIGNSAMESHLDALQSPTPNDKPAQEFYVPIRLLPHNTITRNDQLLLAFDILALRTLFTAQPPYGRIASGAHHRTLPVDLSKQIETAERLISTISHHLAQPPVHHLNRHCSECPFDSLCHQLASAKDDLSLLPNMHAREQLKLNRKGIFTVTQLSYTFRPRRRPTKHKRTVVAYHHSLKALAIRDEKIYITAPAAPSIQLPVVYLDVEGDSDGHFYYLIGLRVCTDISTTQHSYWANSPSEEEDIWVACVRTLASVMGARVFCYGQFDRTFLQRMKSRYPNVAGAFPLIDDLIKSTTNVLSLIYAHVYFPTYSNGLKAVASYLGFTWTHSGSNGMYAMMWRSQWERSGDPSLKQRLIDYNIDDCKALELVTQALARICGKQDDADEAGTVNQADPVVQVDSLKRDYPQRFRRTPFVNAELDYVNRCAYWDYQRNKVYVRTDKSVRRAVRKEVGRERVVPPQINAEIDDKRRPTVCPKCGATSQIYKHARLWHTVYDLRFTTSGVKKWVVRHAYHRYFCSACEVAFQVQLAEGKYGRTLRAFLLYFMIELRVPQNALDACVSQLFGLRLGSGAVGRLKESGSRYYEGLYAELLKRVTHGRMVHVDETKVSIKGKEAFVWVFAKAESINKGINLAGA